MDRKNHTLELTIFLEQENLCDIRLTLYARRVSFCRKRLRYGRISGSFALVIAHGVFRTHACRLNVIAAIKVDELHLKARKLAVNFFGGHAWFEHACRGENVGFDIQLAVLNLLRTQ